MLDELEKKVELTKRGKPRKRKAKQKLDYFDIKTQDAILRYRICTDQSERDKIYSEEIHRSFYKLVENIIHTFKFYHTEVDNLEDLKFEVISFLLQKLDLYKEDKGKAYSYFGTIAKRYLITYNQKNYNRLINKVDIDYVNTEERTLNSLIVTDSIEIDRLSVIETFIEYVDFNLMDLFDSIEEIRAADAILELFKKRDQIDIFNKKALFIYVREMTDAHSSTITKVIKTMKVIYKGILNDFIENRDC
jgi:hypothetical protein